MQSIVLNSAVINYTVYFTDTNELLVRTKNGEEITLTHVLPEEFIDFIESDNPDHYYHLLLHQEKERTIPSRPTETQLSDSTKYHSKEYSEEDFYDGGEPINYYDEDIFGRWVDDIKGGIWLPYNDD
jgi:hypothetical protein